MDNDTKTAHAMPDADVIHPWSDPTPPLSSLSASTTSLRPPPSDSNPADPSSTSSFPTVVPSSATTSMTTSKRNKRWPAYFFPNLATQRMSFCIDILKREDIKSVCEFGCGEAAVLKPMTNAASHIDSFPEPMFDETTLLAAEEDDSDVNEGSTNDNDNDDGSDNHNADSMLASSIPPLGPDNNAASTNLETSLQEKLEGTEVASMVTTPPIGPEDSVSVRPSPQLGKEETSPFSITAMLPTTEEKNVKGEEAKHASSSSLSSDTGIASNVARVPSVSGSEERGRGRSGIPFQIQSPPPPLASAGPPEDEERGRQPSTLFQPPSQVPLPVPDTTALLSNSQEEPVASTSKITLNEDLLAKYRQLPGPRVQDKELHLRRIAGLDLTEDILLDAIEATAPPPEEPSPFSTYFSFSTRERWEDLRVELWQGSLDVYNDALDTFEAFVMTEVIEHLYPKQLEKFPDLLFGSYRPRIIVITTPNYDFNKFFTMAKQQRSGSGNASPSNSTAVSTSASASASQTDLPGTFNAPSVAQQQQQLLTKHHEAGESATKLDETKSSFKDPTGRTDRFFRDSDHKFEWTEAEFKAWCEMITSKFDYTVEYSGVGSLRNYLAKGGMRMRSDKTEAEKKESSDKKAKKGKGRGNSLADDHDDDSDSDSDSDASGPPPHIQEILDSVPDPSKMFATQTAVFRRKYAYESERSPRSPIQMPLAFYGIRPSSSSSAKSAASFGSGGTASQAAAIPKRRSAKQRSVANDTDDSSSSRSPNKRHKLLKAHYFKASPAAGNPKPSKEIRRILDNLMREKMRSRSVSLRELWGRVEVASACGGYINKLIHALVRDKSKNWDILFDSDALERGGQVEDAVQIILLDFKEPKSVWEERADQLALSGGEHSSDGNKKGSLFSDANEDNKDGYDHDDDDDDDDGQEATTVLPVKLSKKQRQQLRMQQAPFLAPVFPLENEAVWMPEPGSEDAKGWEEWTNPPRGSTMISEEQWKAESNDRGSGWI